MNTEKVSWSGRIVSIQPRISLMWSFDERSHSCLGYVLRVEGTAGDESGEFIIAIGRAAQAKHRFMVNHLTWKPIAALDALELVEGLIREIE